MHKVEFRLESIGKVSLEKESMVGRLGILGFGIAPCIYEICMMRVVQWTETSYLQELLVYTIHHI